MSISRTAYDTTACRGYLIQKIKDGLQKASIKNLIFPNQKFNNIYLIQSEHLVDELVPSFNHPIEFSNSTGQLCVAVDVRPYGRKDSATGEYVVRDNNAYNGVIMRALTTKIWIYDDVGPNQLRTFSLLPLNVYANWIGEAVAKRLALEPNDQFTVSILAAVLYLNLFWTDDVSKSPSEMDKTFLVSTITRGLGFKADSVYDIAHAWAGLRNVEDFCNACKDQTQSVRMRDLNPTTLFAMVGGYWYGNNGRELIAAALEHPPTWISLLWQAMTDRSYKNAGLAKILERSTYKRQSEQFNMALANLVRQD